MTLMNYASKKDLKSKFVKTSAFVTIKGYDFMSLIKDKDPAVPSFFGSSI